MPRPSKNLDKRLIHAGVRLFAQKGISSLNIREITREAGVGLGMFTYYFKSKQEFTKRVLESIYEDFFYQLKDDLKDEQDPQKRLRRAGMFLGRFSRDHRALVCSLLHDVMGGNAQASGFFAANVGRHLKILRSIIMDGQKAGILKKAPVDLMLAFFATSINFPNIGTEIVTRAAPKISLLAVNVWKKGIISDQAIAQRVDWAMKAISND